MGFIVDAVLALLLVIAIFACVMVYRRLSVMREGQAEMLGVVEQLNRAVSDAQHGIQVMKQTALEVDEKLGTKVKTARALADELSIITETGNNLADRIERGVSANREAASKGNDLISGPPANQKGTKQLRNKGVVAKKQQDLMSAIKQAR